MHGSDVILTLPIFFVARICVTGLPWDMTVTGVTRGDREGCVDTTWVTWPGKDADPGCTAEVRRCPLASEKGKRKS